MKPLKVLLTSVFLCGSVVGQSPWLFQSTERAINIEVIKPAFDVDGVRLPSVAIFIAGQFPLRDHLLLVADLPSSHFSFSNSGFEETESQLIGNPYLGGRWVQESAILDFGIRLPLASDKKFNASFVGLGADVYREEAFLPDIMSFVGSATWKKQRESGLASMIGLEGLLLVNTGDSNSDSEFFLKYRAGLGFEQPEFSLAATVNGVAILTEDGDVGERTVHQFELQGQAHFDRFRPGVVLRVPLDSDFDFVDYVLGLHIQFDLAD